MPSEWQPIETAPKDGSRFVAWNASKQVLTVARWKEGQFAALNGGFRVWLTHWMPLPDPPLAGEATHE